MTPDLGTRLDTIARALTEVVIPALPPHEVLALEQAALCVGHLAILGEQYRYLADYEALCLAEMSALAASLLAVAAGGPATGTAAEALRGEADRVGAPVDTGGEAAAPEVLPGGAPGRTASAAHQRRNALAGAVDELIRAAGRDGEPEFRGATRRLVLAHGRRQSDRDRAWFRACGMDPDRASLPGIPEMLAAAAG
jgi:hypothetical protein